MKSSLFIAVLVTALVAGCKKNETVTNQAPSEGQPAPTPTTSADNSAAPAPGPGQGVPVAMPNLAPDSTPIPAGESGNMSATLGALSMKVKAYVVGTHKVPQTFEEFVAANPSLQIPPPPPGKKYAFDHKMKVILVNR